MNINLALTISVIGMIASVHLTVKAVLRQRDINRRALADEREEEALYALSQSAGGHSSLFAQKISPLAQLLRPSDVVELNELKRSLNYAGYRTAEALELYHATRATALLIIGALITFILTYMGMTPGNLRLSAILFLMAYILPKWWLKTKISQRQEAINLSLPPTLDLLVTCMEAGLNLEQALDRVSCEIIESDPELADEIRVVLQELNAGLSLSVAFKKLAQRVSADDLKNLCNIIIQSATLGASLGRAMREYSSAARRRRELKLEETAGKVTAKLTLPLTLCLLPSAMIAMLAPAIVTIVKSLSN